MTSRSHSVAAIVPAFNEQETVGGVVRVLVSSKLFGEVIVVSDGSTDGTAARAREAGASLVHELPFRHGKGAAMAHGVTHTDAPVLFFADADLYGLSKKNLEAVLGPVLDGKKVMNVGIRDRGPFFMKLSAHLPLIGGERALVRKVFEDIPDAYKRGFMVESALNFFCRSRRLRYGSVPCLGLTIRRKTQKVGMLRGALQYLHMWWQIIKAMTTVRLAYVSGKF